MTKFNNNQDNYNQQYKNEPDTAQEFADNLGEIKSQDDTLQSEIDRLRRKKIVQLHQVRHTHDWLEGKRKSRQSCRIVGDSRTGKTIACEAYKLRHKPKQERGKPPVVPVMHIQPPQECSARDFFRVIIEELQYKVVKGTVGEIRNRTLKILQGCQVEMLIIDEADRLKPKTFADVRDIFDKLNISVVLVGTARIDNVLTKDEQVRNRFLSCYRFGKLSGIEFQKTVTIWEQHVLKLPVASNLHCKNMLDLLKDATGGYIGLLDMILRDAAIRALEKGLKKIDKATLKEIADEYRFQSVDNSKSK